MSQAARGTRLLLIILPLGLAAGCGNKDLGAVHGTVTMDGAPLENAMVTFTPAEGGRPAAGRTDASGNYELIYSRSDGGALIGEHVVRISTFSETVDEEGNEMTLPETVPTKYNVASELKRTVTDGANEFNFDLESGGEIIQPVE